MSVLLRLALAAAIALLAGGASVTPHPAVAGWTHEGLDHPPSAVHATLLQHLQWLAKGDRTVAPDGAAFTGPDAAAFANAPAALAVGTLTLALLFFRAPRPWRPARLGVSAPSVLLDDEQFAAIVPQAPPRPSLSA